MTRLIVSGDSLRLQSTRNSVGTFMFVAACLCCVAASFCLRTWVNACTYLC